MVDLILCLVAELKWLLLFNAVVIMCRQKSRLQKSKIWTDMDCQPVEQVLKKANVTTCSFLRTPWLMQIDAAPNCHVRIKHAAWGTAASRKKQRHLTTTKRTSITSSIQQEEIYRKFENYLANSPPADLSVQSWETDEEEEEEVVSHVLASHQRYMPQNPAKSIKSCPHLDPEQEFLLFPNLFFNRTTPMEFCRSHLRRWQSPQAPWETHHLCLRKTVGNLGKRWESVWNHMKGFFTAFTCKQNR